ncbi:MAG: hypothetical protein U9O78_03695 [Patescibacteria group bacterium]|nr:hypothetical protein [Patescibacteria group bacterium]
MIERGSFPTKIQSELVNLLNFTTKWGLELKDISTHKLVQELLERGNSCFPSDFLEILKKLLPQIKRTDEMRAVAAKEKSEKCFDNAASTDTLAETEEKEQKKEIIEIIKKIKASDVMAKHHSSIFQAYQQGELRDYKSPETLGCYSLMGDIFVGQEDQPFFSKNNIARFLIRISRGAKNYPNEFGKYMDYHIICIQDYGDGSAMFCMYFNQDKKIPDPRKSYTMSYLGVKLPIQEAKRLAELIKLDPDMLEFFYKNAFPGLDDDESEEKPTGLRRVKSPGFIFFNPEDLDEMPSYFDYAFFKNLKEKLNIYPFKNGPYGVGVPFGES